MVKLENGLVARYFPLAYYLAMSNESFRDRVLSAMGERRVKKAELSRLSGVPYHTLDKFLKREGATTSAENAQAIARALGINVDDNSSYDELRRMFYQLDEESQQFVLKSIRGLLGE